MSIENGLDVTQYVRSSGLAETIIERLSMDTQETDSYFFVLHIRQTDRAFMVNIFLAGREDPHRSMKINPTEMRLGIVIDLTCDQCRTLLELGIEHFQITDDQPRSPDTHTPKKSVAA